MNEQPEQPQAEIKSQPATMTMTVQITRAATGKVETYDLVLTPLPQEKEPE